MFALSIFLIGLTFIFVSWNDYQQKLYEEREKAAALQKLYDVSKIWEEEGSPKRWNTTNVVSLGVVNERSINVSKLLLLKSLGYEKVKKLLGISLYEVYFRISDKNNQTLFEFGRFPSDPEVAVKSNRICVYNSTISLVETVVWK